MTSEYAQFRQWSAVCEAIARLAHRPFDPVVITESQIKPEDDVVGEYPQGEVAAVKMHVVLLIIDGRYAFTFERAIDEDWQIEMRVAFADTNIDDSFICFPTKLRARLDAEPSKIALEILHLVE